MALMPWQSGDGADEPCGGRWDLCIGRWLTHAISSATLPGRHCGFSVSTLKKNQMSNIPVTKVGRGMI